MVGSIRENIIQVIALIIYLSKKAAIYCAIVIALIDKSYILFINLECNYCCVL